MNLADVRLRLSARGVDGRFLPAESGLETEDELKSLLILIVENGHHDLCGEACFFSSAKKIHPDSLAMAVDALSRDIMLKILKEECACRNQQKSRTPFPGWRRALAGRMMAWAQRLPYFKNAGFPGVKARGQR